MLGIILLSGLACALLIGTMIIPKRSTGQSFGSRRDDPSAPTAVQSAPHSPQPTFYQHVDTRTMRQRQSDEDAHMLASEFQRYEDERYRGEVRDRAARAFGPPSAPTVNIPAPAAAPRPAPAA